MIDYANAYCIGPVRPVQDGRADKRHLLWRTSLKDQTNGKALSEMIFLNKMMRVATQQGRHLDTNSLGSVVASIIFDRRPDGKNVGQARGQDAIVLRAEHHPAIHHGQDRGNGFDLIFRNREIVPV